MTRQGWGWVLGALCVVVAGIVATVIVTSDDDERPRPPPSTSTSTSTTTTTAPPVDDVSPAVFPTPGSGERFTDPVAAANAFVTAYLGFEDPFVGGFRRGDTRSGEVSVQPFAEGPITTVFLRQLGADDAWSVIGTATENITVASPAALATITSPVALGGSSTAFEGTVQVHLRADGREAPIATGFVTGGANGEIRPFDGSLAFEAPGVAGGTLILFTVSAESGGILEAAVVRVRFA